MEVSGWLVRDLETLLRDVREVVAFLGRAEDERTEFAGRANVQRDQVILSSTIAESRSTSCSACSTATSR